MHSCHSFFFMQNGEHAYCTTRRFIHIVFYIVNTSELSSPCAVSSSASSCAVKALKSSSPSIKPRLLPLSNSQCTVPISSTNFTVPRIPLCIGLGSSPIEFNTIRVPGGYTFFRYSAFLFCRTSYTRRRSLLKNLAHTFRNRYSRLFFQPPRRAIFIRSPLSPTTVRCSIKFFRRQTPALLAATGMTLPTANIPRSPFPYPCDSSFSFRPEMPACDTRF